MSGGEVGFVVDLGTFYYVQYITTKITKVEDG